MNHGGKPLAVTLGEPAGIGPDITIDAWLARHEQEVAPFLFVGDAAVLERRAAAMGRTITTAITTPAEAVVAFPDALPCLSGAAPAKGHPGEMLASDTSAVIQSIRQAVQLADSGAVAAIVTNPINKKALNAVGFPFPGHTEFLGALAHEIDPDKAQSVMMLAGPELRVVPVTIHIPLAAVRAALSVDLIVATGTIVAGELKHRFGIDAPRLAIAGLNPHAGEDGMLGSEDMEIVEPAVAALRAANIDARGPLPADTMFHAEARATYDAALCMYHDQALIPIKTLAFDDAVNVTLGLPFVRTSPDHGTALPLAASGRARPTSLIAALAMAQMLAGRATDP